MILDGRFICICVLCIYRAFVVLVLIESLRVKYNGLLCKFLTDNSGFITEETLDTLVIEKWNSNLLSYNWSRRVEFGWGSSLAILQRGAWKFRTQWHCFCVLYVKYLSYNKRSLCVLCSHFPIFSFRWLGEAIYVNYMRKLEMKLWLPLSFSSMLFKTILFMQKFCSHGPKWICYS